MSPAPTIIFGEGEIYNLTKILRKAGKTRAMVVYDQGVAAFVKDILARFEDFPYETFDGIVPESPDYVVEELRNKARSTESDAFIAIGGGSTMDTTRAAMMLSTTSEPVRDFFDRPYEGETKSAFFICIPTTAGTGAEMSAAGPILNTETNIKKGLMVPLKQADIVILDPLTTASLPPYVAYCCAMDALAHSIEAMTGKNRNAMTDMICGQAVEYIWKYLPKVMADPTDVDARGHLMLASNMAIGCQNIRQLGHAVCQPIGAKLHLSHGYSCALVLPAMLMSLSGYEDLKDSFAYVAERMGVPHDNNPAESLAKAVAERNAENGVVSLEEKGYSFDDTIACTEEILQDQRLLPNCPVEVTEELIEKTIRGMYSGI